MQALDNVRDRDEVWPGHVRDVDPIMQFGDADVHVGARRVRRRRALDEVIVRIVVRENLWVGGGGGEVAGKERARGGDDPIDLEGRSGVGIECYPRVVVGLT